MLKMSTFRTRHTAKHSFTPTGVLQRECTCGRAVGPTSECGGCRKKRGLGEQRPTVQPKLRVNHPGDRCERAADRVASQVMQARPLTSHLGGLHGPARLTVSRQSQASRPTNGLSDVPQVVRDVLHSPGQPLDQSTRSFAESRLGHDFSAVRVHTDTRAAESAEAVQARAYTVGRDMVFAAGEYRPATSGGRRLLTHELAHVIQQNSALGPRLQRFTAELEGDRIYVKPETGDTDRDLDRVLCPQITNREIAGRTSIDVTDCFPPGTIKAMGLGPYNCADFVRRAIGQTLPEGGLDADWLITLHLWEELLKKGFQVRSFGVVTEQGKVEPAEGLSWKQLDPRMGDFVFMMGSVVLPKGENEPNRKGDNFTVTWDHVAIFVVRSRGGLDYHLAKDGDENPTGLYHTGMEPEESPMPGAYVKGASTLLAYLGQIADEEIAAKDVYLSGAESEAYWALPDEERGKIIVETDRRFQNQTGVTRKLDWNDPKDQPLARQWLRIRDQVMRESSKQSKDGSTP